MPERSHATAARLAHASAHFRTALPSAGSPAVYRVYRAVYRPASQVRASDGALRVRCKPEMETTVTDVRASGARSPLEPRAHLIVALECGRPLAGSVGVQLARASRVELGRGDRRHVEDDGDATLTIRVPDVKMSSSHATLERDGDGWVAIDRGSKNGTFVGHAQVTRQRLADGDLLRLGQTFFVFRDRWPTDPGAAAVIEAPASAPPLTTLVPALGRHFQEIERVAPTDVPVLLHGETGTGKEVMARTIHALSRRLGDLVAVNCSSLPTNLVESELFGHKRGAFSGAFADHAGLFRSAERGTILLDEIGDLPLVAQGALLRVLQEAEVTPVGATRPVRIDVRVLAATHRDLESLVRAGTFREDLLARLGGFTARLPSLRARREDLGLLCAVLLSRLAPPGQGPSLTSAAGAALFGYSWPRNIRELDKCLGRAMALAEAGTIDVAHLGLPAATEPAGKAEGGGAVPESERRDRLVAALTTHRGNVTAVARALRTSPSQVHRWLKRFGLALGDFR